MTWALASLIGSAGVWLYGIMGDSWWYLSGAIGLLGAFAITAKTRNLEKTEKCAA